MKGISKYFFAQILASEDFNQTIEWGQIVGLFSEAHSAIPLETADFVPPEF